MKAIRCVSGESSKCGSTLTLMNDLSRRCPTHAQLPLYPGEGQTVGVCVKGGAGGQRLSSHVLLFAWVCAVAHTRCRVCIILATLCHTCEWHGVGITRVSGLGSGCQ